MMERRTFFQGGLKLEHSHWADPDQAPVDITLPVKAFIPCRQHQGVPAELVVKPGQTVEEGQVLARSPDSLRGAHIFSSIPGKVLAVHTLPRPDGTGCAGVEIGLGGQFSMSRFRPEGEDWRGFSASRIRQIIADLGLVSQDPHAKPLLAMLPPLPDLGELHVVLNFMQTDGYRSSSWWAALHRSTELVQAMEILTLIYGRVQFTLAFPLGLKPRAGQLRRAFGSGPAIRLRFLDPVYPQEDSRLLFQTISGRDLTARQRMELGYVVLDPETLLVLRDGVVLGRPQLDRLVNVSGHGAGKPGLYRVRLGTPLSQVLEEVSWNPRETARLVVGDPLRGQSLTDITMPLTRDIGALVLLGPHEVNQAAQQPCMRCGECMRSCPMGLEPRRLFRLLGQNNLDQAVKEGLMDCSLCGICSRICPSRVPLTAELAQGRDRSGLRDTLDSAVL